METSDCRVGEVYWAWNGLRGWHTVKVLKILDGDRARIRQCGYGTEKTMPIAELHLEKPKVQ